MAWREDVDYPLIVDKELGFYAMVDREKKSAEQLINEEFSLMNDAAIEFDLHQAMEISAKILKHNQETNKL